MTLTDEAVLERVEQFLATSGMSPTRFGLEAMSEGGLVNSLRRGRSLTLRSANRVLTFIETRQPGEGEAESEAAAP